LRSLSYSARMASTPLTQQQFWDDFGARVLQPLSEILVKSFMDQLFNAPLPSLPPELRAVAGPLRATRRKELESLIPPDIRGQAKRGVFMKGVEAGVRDAPVRNPYLGSSWGTRGFSDIWEAGRVKGTTWRRARRTNFRERT